MGKSGVRTVREAGPYGQEGKPGVDAVEEGGLWGGGFGPPVEGFFLFLVSIICPRPLSEKGYIFQHIMLTSVTKYTRYSPRFPKKPYI